MVNDWHFKNFRNRQAFTLTEVAIVLGAAALILGAVWLAANSVLENNGVTNVLRQIMTTVNNIRNQYVAIQIWPAAAGTDVTIMFDSLKPSPLPVEMRGPAGTTNYFHALNGYFAGGSFHILTANDPVTGSDDAFRLELMGLKQSSCTKLLSQLPLGDSTVGIINVLVNGTAAAVIADYQNTGGTPTWSTAVPIPPPTAAADCDITGATNEIDIDFRLHP